MIRLVILDRDGVLNEDRPDHVKSLEEFVMLEKARPAVAKLNAAGIKVAVATNQSSVGRGLIDEATLQQIHEKLHRELAAYQAHVDHIFYAPDHPDAPTHRRKPGPGMMEEALAHFKVKPEETVVIGDALRDLEAAHAAGCRPVLVRTGKGAATEKALTGAFAQTQVYDNLLTAVVALLKENGPETDA